MRTAKNAFLLLSAISVSVCLPYVAQAHVGYVEPRSLLTLHSDLAQFYRDLFSSPTDVGLLIVIPLFVLVVLFGLLRNDVLKNFGQRLSARAHSYTEYVPWIIRLSLGIGLVGAGTSQLLIAPTLPISNAFISFEIFTGFCLLVGLFLPFTYVLTIVLYLLAVIQDYYLLGNMDVFVLALAGLVLSDPRPGVDDLIDFAPRFVTTWKQYLPKIFRIAVGAEMAFLAVYEKFLNPWVSEKVVIDYHLQSILPVSSHLWVVGTGLVELAVGLLLVFGIRTRLVSVIAFLVLSFTFFYFQESVYSHVTLFGAMSIIFIYGNKLEGEK